MFGVNFIRHANILATKLSLKPTMEFAKFGYGEGIRTEICLIQVPAQPGLFDLTFQFPDEPGAYAYHIIRLPASSDQLRPPSQRVSIHSHWIEKGKEFATREEAEKEFYK